MKAEIVATGTELLLGQITDTNTPFLADQLALLGIDVYYTGIVGDNYTRMLGVLQQAWQRSDLVITTGGLGPTKGDITRDVIAGLLGETTYIDSSLKNSIEAFFANRNWGMPANNLKQAALIFSASPLFNPYGTAPGWWVEKDGRIIIALPGPPRELQPMWQAQVLPRLQQRSGSIIVSRMLKTAGISEGKLDEMVSEYTSQPNPTLAMYAKNDGIYLRITAKADQRARAQALIDQREKDLYNLLGEFIWGVDDDTLEKAVSVVLKQKGLTLAVNESTFSGGYLTHILANGPIENGFFKGGLVTADEAGDNPEKCLEMAGQARQQFGASVGLAVGGRVTEEGGIQVGRVTIAIDGENGMSRTTAYSGIYPHIRRRAAYFALFDLRRALIG